MIEVYNQELGRFVSLSESRRIRERDRPLGIGQLPFFNQRQNRNQPDYNHIGLHPHLVLGELPEVERAPQNEDQIEVIAPQVMENFAELNERRGEAPLIELEERREERQDEEAPANQAALPQEQAPARMNDAVQVRNGFTAFTEEEIALIEDCPEISDAERNLCQCPFSYKIMRFPVLSLDDNMFYDKEWVLESIRHNPQARGINGIPLKVENLIPVRPLFQEIHRLLDRAKAAANRLEGEEIRPEGRRAI